MNRCIISCIIVFIFSLPRIQSSHPLEWLDDLNLPSKVTKTVHTFHYENPPTGQEVCYTLDHQHRGILQDFSLVLLGSSIRNFDDIHLDIKVISDSNHCIMYSIQNAASTSDQSCCTSIISKPLGMVPLEGTLYLQSHHQTIYIFEDLNLHLTNNLTFEKNFSICLHTRIPYPGLGGKIKIGFQIVNEGFPSIKLTSFDDAVLQSENVLKNRFPVPIENMNLVPGIIAKVVSANVPVNDVDNSQIVIYVNSEIDSHANISSCVTNQSITSQSSCNLRSALASCNSTLSNSYNSTCVIEITPHSRHILNGSYGVIILKGNSGSLSLIGNGCEIVSSRFVYGGPSSGFLQVLPSISSSPSGLHVMIVNCSIRGFGGSDISGGGIYADSIAMFSLKDVHFEYNEGYFGGGAYFFGIIQVEMYRTHFYHNFAEEGGGIFLTTISNKSLISDCHLWNNSASQGGGISFHYNSMGVIFERVLFEENFGLLGGGAVSFIHNISFILISESSFLNNSCGRYLDDNSNLGLGGAIFLNDRITSLTITSSHFSQNQAAVDGCLAMDGSSRDVLIYDSLFTENESDFDSSAITVAGYNVSILDCIFFHNRASTSFAAVSFLGVDTSTIQNCSFINNSPFAIYAELENVGISIKYSTFLMDKDLSQTSDGLILLKGSFSGSILDSIFVGGLELVNSPLIFDFDGKLVVYRCSFHELGASQGGAISHSSSFANLFFNSCNFTNNTAHSLNGGAVYLSHFSNSTFSNCRFANNTALLAGGAIYSQGSLLLDNCIFEDNKSVLYGGGAVSLYSDYAVTIYSSTFRNNKCNSGGGALELLDNHPSISIWNSSFISNMAVISGGGSMLISMGNANIMIANSLFMSNEGPTGGIYIDNGNIGIQIISCEFLENRATSDGGALILQSSNADVHITNCLFRGNSGYRGGGISIQLSNTLIRISNCTFAGNTAANTGGGILFGSWNQFVISNSTFLRNEGVDGGGLYLYSNNIASLDHVAFSENHAIGKGGALYMGFRNMNAHYYSLLFESNSANEGGGIYLQSGNDNFILINSHLSKNRVTRYGGGMFVQDSNLDVNVLNCTFLSNNAVKYGGGIMLQSANYRFRISNCSMDGNVAGSAGGSIHSSLFNEMLKIIDTQILNSESTYGGGVFIGNDHVELSLQNVLMFRCTSIFGGGMYVTPFNQQVDLVNTSFIECNSLNYGAAVYSFADHNIFRSCSIFHCRSDLVAGIYCENGRVTVLNGKVANNTTTSPSQSTGPLTVVDGDALEVYYSDFINNVAYTGAGINTKSVEIIKIVGCSIVNNSGSQGGGLSIQSNDYSSITDSIISFNRGDTGAGIYLLDSQSSNFINLLFSFNNGNLAGGAFAAYSSTIVFSNNNFQNNSVVTDGSALYLDSSLVSLSETTFLNNVAQSGGGSVFWITTSQMPEPEYLRNSTLNYFQGNTAPYGPNWATNGCQLITDDEVYNITLYGTAIPAIVISFKDFYNQTVIVDSSTQVEAIFPYTQSCYAGAQAYLTGETVAKMSSGYANFSALQVYCSPGDSVFLTFQTIGSSKFEKVVQLNFRNCLRGEYYAAQECVSCETGTYSLNPDKSDLSKMDQISVCKPCPANTVSCYGDVLELEKGYWRISGDSDAIQVCPYGKSACHGGDLVGDESCATGYEGPLCAVCSSDYALQSSTKTCVPCSRSDGLDISDIIFLSALMALIVGLLYYFTRPEIRAQIKSMDDFVLFMITRLRIVDMKDIRNRKEVITYARTLSRRLTARLKVYITMYQILSVLPFVLDLAFPWPVSVFLSVLNFLNLSITGSSMVSCSTFSYNFIDSLLVDTIYPIVVVGLLFSIRWIHIQILRLRFNKQSSVLHLDEFENRISNISSTYFFIFLVFTYLILPSVVTKIFQTFR